MKKVVPLALLVGSSLAFDSLVYDSSWDATATPVVASTGTATQCCFFTGTVGIGASGAVTGTLDTAYATGNKCTQFYSSNTGNPLDVTLTASSPQLAVTTGKDATSAGSGGVSASVSKDGSTLTLRLASITAQTYNCQQTLTRRLVTAPTGVTGTTTWTPAAGTLTGVTAADCCFFTTGKNLVITNTNGVVKTSGATTDTSAACSNGAIGTGAEYIQTLKAGANPPTAVNLLDANADQFTLNTGVTPNTITFVPRGTSGCSQTLTRAADSGANIASIMTPVVVGAAALALYA